MESNVFDYNEVKYSDNFGMKKYHNSIYKGELLNGKRHGRGIMIYTNRLYEGDWDND